MAKKNSTPKSDERNIVGAEQVSVQDVEDQLFLVWEKNKGLIIGGIVFIFAAFFGYQGLKFMQEGSEQARIEGYQSADDKAAWAKSESGHAISGFAEKELGDAAYLEGNFSAAAEHYEASAKSAKSAVKEAATLGLGMALLQQGKTNDAKKYLQSLADDESAANQAEAQFQLALIAKSESDFATARSLIEAISEEASYWKARAQNLEQELPKSDA